MKSLLFLALVSVASASQQDKIAELFRRVNELSQKQDNLELTVGHSQEHSAKVGTYAPGNGFTARPTASLVYGANEKVDFGDLYLNTGSSFNATNFEYTCPSDGIYTFSLTADSTGGHFSGRIVKRELSQVELYIAEVLVEEPVEDGVEATIRGNGHVTTMVECLANEVVYVRSGTGCVDCQLTRSSRFVGAKLGTAV